MAYQESETLHARHGKLGAWLRRIPPGWVLMLAAFFIFGVAVQQANPQQGVSLTFFGDALDDIVFARVGYAVVTLGARSGLLVSADLAGVVGPQVVQVTLMAAGGRVLDRRIAKVNFDTFSVFFPGVSLQSVRGIFVDKP